MSEKEKKQREKKVKSHPVSSSGMHAGAGMLSTMPSGAVMRSGQGTMPPGLFSPQLLALDADVSNELGDLAPRFGDVLLSIGTGVAQSQDALDMGMVNAATQLSNTKIDVVSEVIQELDDDGLPDPEATQLIQNEVSLINYISPTVHEWKHVALSMDLSVGALDYETGMTFEKTQRKGGTHAYGMFWGFLGWFDTDTQESTTRSSRSTDYEADWAQGQVRMDAMLGPRRTEKFPVPAEVSIGPQLFFSLGSVSEIITNGAVSERAMDIVIKIRKANGDANPTVNIEIESNRYNFSFYDTDGFDGSTANAEGEVKIRVSRPISNALFQRRTRGSVSARLGQITKKMELSL